MIKKEIVEKVPEAAEEVISAAFDMVEPVPENVYAPSVRFQKLIIIEITEEITERILENVVQFH